MAPARVEVASQSLPSQPQPHSSIVVPNPIELDPDPDVHDAADSQPAHVDEEQQQHAAPTSPAGGLGISQRAQLGRSPACFFQPRPAQVDEPEPVPVQSVHSSSECLYIHPGHFDKRGRQSPSPSPERRLSPRSLSSDSTDPDADGLDIHPSHFDRTKRDVAPAMNQTATGEAAVMTSSPEVRKQKKKKVLLMGKSGSGKSSMRSIIFSNYVAKDTRRLGATIDVDLSHVKFLGNLTLNLWDCGGQDAFMENYLYQQRAHVFSNVGVLIYVFDIESRDFDRDLLTYRSIISALGQFSPSSTVYILIHKMDLIAPHLREESYNDRISIIRDRSESFDPIPFATSIWDQSLYKAWAEIIHDLVPNLPEIERHLHNLGTIIEAEEVMLFERASFLVVSSWCSTTGKQNPTIDRFERLSNIIKNFKQSTSRYTGTPKSAEQFVLTEMKLSRFSMFIVKFTTNTYLAAVLPPGEERFNCAMENTRLARREFENLDSPPRRGVDRGAGAAGESRILGGSAFET